MADIRYEQYGTPVGYSPHDKSQMTYPKRNVPGSRFGNGPAGNSNQGRVVSQQKMGMGNQAISERGLTSNIGDDQDGYNQYNMIQGNRLAPQQVQYNNQLGNDIDQKALSTPQQGRQTLQSSGSNQMGYSVGNTPKMSANIPETRHEEFLENKLFYKYYSGVIIGRMTPIQSFNYVLPPSYMFPSPEVTAAHIHTFSTSLLLYIFYTFTRDAMQVMSANELYTRDMVFHKTKKTWYRKEKASANYAVINCSNVFSLEKWLFVSCNEIHKINDVLSLTEITEYMKLLPN